MNNMILLPTTLHVDQAITLAEATKILEQSGYTLLRTGSVIDGMYLSNAGEIVKEQLLEIWTNATPGEICRVFDQECVLEVGAVVRLIGKCDEILIQFESKREYYADSIENAINHQMRWARKYGGSSRIGFYVWSYV